MQQQRRCLTGMTNGLPLAVPSTKDDFVVIHTLAASSNAGLAELDVVEMHLHNASKDDLTVTVAFLSPTNVAMMTLTYAVPSRTSVKVFDEDAFGGPLSGLGGNKIALSASGREQEEPAVTAWGWFFRSRG